MVCALSSAPLFLAAEVFFDPISALLGLKSQLVNLISIFNLTDLMAKVLTFNLRLVGSENVVQTTLGLNKNEQTG